MFTWRSSALLIFIAAVVCLRGVNGASSESEFDSDLRQLLRLLPESREWSSWLEVSGEKPPDYDRIKPTPYLPDPLAFESGNSVDKENWPQRRAELLRLLQRHLLGRIPVSAGEVRIDQTVSSEEAGAFIERTVLEFGPEHGAKLRIELIVPRTQPPFPSLILPVELRSWGLVAVSRGYAVCLYGDAPGEEWGGIWPEQDWSELTQKAWGVSRCVDYLQQLPFLSKERMAVGGHGESGKVSLIAGVLDIRLGAIIVSSSGPGGVCPWRLFNESRFGPGIEGVTREEPGWFHPRLRFFSGREAMLPIDQHQLLACLAPRPCLVASAVNDPNEDIWAIEQAYYSAQRVYEKLGRPHDLNLRFRAGNAGLSSGELELLMDWLDTVFGRRRFVFPGATVFPTYEQWNSVVGAVSDDVLDGFPTNDGLRGLLLESAESEEQIQTASAWARRRNEIRERILWVLGLAPPFAESAGTNAEPAGATGQGLLIRFGNGLSGRLFYPANSGTYPAVIWLPPACVASGWDESEVGGPFVRELAQAGLAVFAFDPIGQGARIGEVQNFYARYPGWSILGKQVEDVLAAAEVLGRTARIDSSRVFLAGYGMGATVALHAAALDDRFAGAVAVAGFTPMRLDTMEKRAGGLARWAGWFPYSPRLGAFLGRENQVPYDFHEVLAMIAPRPAVVYQPVIDPGAHLEDVQTAVAEAGKVYDLLGSNRLRFYELADYNRLSRATRDVVADKLVELAGSDR